MRKRGFLPHEENAEAFSKHWVRIEKRLRGGPELPKEAGERLLLEWSSLSHEFLVDDLAPMLRSDLYHCHEFAKAVAALAGLKHERTGRQKKDSGESPRPPDLIEEVSRVLRRVRLVNGQERRDLLRDLFDPETLARAPAHFSLFRPISVLAPSVGAQYVQQTIDRAIAAAEYVSDEVSRYYFGKAREYIAQRIVRAEVGTANRRASGNARLDIIDLPSFPDGKTRLLALNSVLATIWQRARIEWASAIAKPDSADERVPTFLVVDEAHNLLPHDPRDLGPRALLEQFRMIAAEGRKYGLFLILCTQRPDKIDPLVLSECENRAIMRLGSKSVLDTTEKLLGLEDVPQKKMSKCLEFETGRALLVGRWAQEPQLLYTAMRRTIEGGRSLRDDHWATPAPAVEAPEPSPAAVSDKQKALRNYVRVVARKKLTEKKIESAKPSTTESTARKKAAQPGD
jgi:hypothetical protein